MKIVLMDDDGRVVETWDTNDFDLSKTNHIFCLGRAIVEAIDRRELDQQLGAAAHG